MAKAARAAAALKDELGVEAELIVGHSGIFEVAVDGSVVVAKTRAGFPTPEQVVESVAKVLPRT